MKSYIFILLSIITSSSCQSDNSDITQKETKVPRDILQKQHINETDSIVEVKNTKMDKQQTPPKSLDQVELLKPSAIDVDINPGDPFEDPDYIGTPCGDYMNGKCTRHPHPKDLIENESDFVLKMDSLKYE